MTAPSPAQTAARCPVDGCTHEFDLTVKLVADTALANVFGLGVLAAAHRNQQIADHERALDVHFRTHTTLEFVRSLIKAEARAASAEDLHDRLVKLARRLSPQPGDLVKGWIDEGGSAQGVLLTDEEAKAASEWPDLPSYYAVVKLSPSGQVVTVMRDSLRGVEP
jgi:hypothetical protein